MSISGINNTWAGAYPYANRINKMTTDETNFAEQLQKTGEAADTSVVDAYTEYLKSKYGNVRIQSVGRDQQSLDKIAKSMSGNDVVIAPNILEQMANDSEKAAYYEGKIDYFFNTVIPKETAICASKGLVFEPCGVVVHEDGTVTYICGCSDSPERVAEVNAINKAKREKRAAQRKANLERSQEAAEKQRQAIERAYNRKSMVEMLTNHTAEVGRVTYIGTSETMKSIVDAYEMNAMSIPNVLM